MEGHIVRVQCTKGDVLEKAVAKNGTGLLNQGNVLAKPVNIEACNGSVVYRDLPGVGFVETRKEAAQRALPGATSANHKCKSPWLKT